MRSRLAIVIGPTPPGTGVMWPATSIAAGSTSPTSPASVRLKPTSTTAAPCFTMSAVTSQQEMRYRLSDDVTAAHDDRFRALERDVVIGEQRHDPDRRRRHERRPAEVELAGVEGMKAVDVLHRLDGADHAPLVDVVRQRELHENAVDCVVAVQFGDPLE